jgi:transposase-like protein
MSMLTKRYFQSEKAAFEHLEATLWNDGVICPHCGSLESARKLQGVKDKKGRVRNGLWKCYAKECRKQFTVKVGTVFECAHIPLHKVLQAVYLMSSSKKGISAHQMHRTLEITHKSAWFLCHRIREAMRDGTLAPMGGAGGIVEVDETFIGKLEGQQAGPYGGWAHKNVVLTYQQHKYCRHRADCSHECAP